MKSSSLWPLAIVAILTLTVGANVAMYVAASDPHASAVEPDYYRKAIAWDSSAAAARRAERLGWTVEADLLDASPAGATVRVRPIGPDGRVLEHATVRVEAIHNRRADAPVRGALPEAGRRGYAARMPLTLPGLWELRIEVVRGGERMTMSVRREATWPSAR